MKASPKATLDALPTLDFINQSSPADMVPGRGGLCSSTSCNTFTNLQVDILNQVAEGNKATPARSSGASAPASC